MIKLILKREEYPYCLVHLVVVVLVVPDPLVISLGQRVEDGQKEHADHPRDD